MSTTILTTSPPGTPEWLAAHQGKIGGSTVASILGMGLGNRTPLRVWAELTGKIPREDISRLPHVRIGTLMEPIVKRLYEEESQRVVLPTPGLIQHPNFDWLAGTPDGLVEINGLRVPWEAKTYGNFKARDWGDGAVPLAYQVQVQFYMTIMGVEQASIAAVPRDGDEDTPACLWQDIVIDPVFCDFMYDRLMEFRDKHWLADIPPGADFGKDLETIKAMFPRESPGRVVEMTEEAVQRWTRKEELASQATAIEKELKAETAWLKAFMGDAEYGIGPGWWLRCRVEPRKEHIVSASEPRVLRKVKPQ